MGAERTARKANTEKEAMHMYAHRVIAPLLMTAALALGPATGAFAAPKSSTAKAKSPAAASLLTRVAAVEGVTPKVLRQDLQQGQTLLQIAGNKYADANALATALLAPVKARLDTAVTNHRMTAAQENTRYAHRLSKMTTLVTTAHPPQSLRHSTKWFKRAKVQQVVYEVAAACQTTPAALTTLVRGGGTSILAACQTTNPAATQAQLTNIVFAPIKAKLDRAVAKGTMAASQEQRAIAKAQAKIGKALTKTLPARSATGA
jgi:hypothetical protein